MLSKFKEQLIADHPNVSDLNIYVAASGGKDSMVLSHLLLACGIKHTLLHCNFQLRGKESDEDENFLRSYAKQNELPILVERFDTYAQIEKIGKGVQETARDLRYGWFRSIALKNHEALILTAHHLDDSLETFFINLLRGTGHKGVNGIPRFNGDFYRPLLSFAVEDIYNYIDSNGLVYREDSSNSEDKYLRNKIRHSILPLLSDLEPDFKSKMLSFFKEMDGVKTFVRKESIAWLSEISIDGSTMSKFKSADLISADMLKLQVGFSDFNIKKSNVDEFRKFLLGSTGNTFNSSSHEFLLDREFLRIKLIEPAEPETVELVESFPSLLKIDKNRLDFKIIPRENLRYSNNPAHLDLDKIELPITIRHWRQGDKIYPLGMKGSKLISDVLIDNKFSQFEKRDVLVIEDHTNQIISILGLIVAETFKVDNSSSRILQINLTEDATLNPKHK